uniref:Uncharacterized protein n=1 Tax=Chlamydomonas euryale TaxID=1486919 RepID=A0A7R9YSL8_9CHLO|mmetsp:Transcript_20768/g.62094  ORF Transcript_20768/g.62094 Transcript_20768/m.62094 type:complete len:1135 (+) Transcript_20768:640-4044(+)
MAAAASPSKPVAAFTALQLGDGCHEDVDAGAGTTCGAKVVGTSARRPAWLGSATEQGLIMVGEAASRREDVPAAAAGVSLAWLRCLASVLDATVGLDGKDTAAVVKTALLPAVKHRKTRLFDLIPPKHTGPPEYYVVHAWNAPFRSLISQLCAKLVPQESVEDGQQDSDSDSAKGSCVSPVEASTFVWLDIVALNQVPSTAFKISNAPDIAIVREQAMMQACPGGVVAVIDHSFAALTRTWCLYEMWVFVHYQETDKLQMALPDNLTASELVDFEARVRGLDMTRTSSTKPSDKSKLLTEIKSAVGLKIMTREVSDALIVVARAHLRWACGMRGVGRYCLMLGICGEFARLQTMLYSIPELTDDEEQFKEIMQVFLAYAGGLEEELDLDAFVKVLTAANFTAAEAHSIYHQVNTDGGPGVGYEEFKEWWLKTLRVERMQKRPPCQMTAASLADNMQKMHALLQREGLTDIAEEFKALSDQISDGTLLRPGATLPVSALHGDWADASDQVMWKMYNHRYRDAAHMLYEALMWNADSLATSPMELPKPREFRRCGVTRLFSMLQRLLRAFSDLIKHQATRQQHVEYFAKLADDLDSDSNVQALSECMRDAGGGLTCHDAAHFAILRNMINLKYGVGAPLSPALITEAERSVATWKANQRSAGHAARGNMQLHGTLKDLAADYINSPAVRTVQPAGIVAGKASSQLARSHTNKVAEVISRDDSESVLMQLGPEAIAFLMEQTAGQSQDPRSKARDSKEQQTLGERSEAHADGGNRADGAAAAAAGDVSQPLDASAAASDRRSSSAASGGSASSARGAAPAWTRVLPTPTPRPHATRRSSLDVPRRPAVPSFATFTPCAVDGDVAAAQALGGSRGTASGGLGAFEKAKQVLSRVPVLSVSEKMAEAKAALRAVGLLGAPGGGVPCDIGGGSLQGASTDAPSGRRSSLNTPAVGVAASGSGGNDGDGALSLLAASSTPHERHQAHRNLPPIGERRTRRASMDMPCPERSSGSMCDPAAPPLRIGPLGQLLFPGDAPPAVASPCAVRVPCVLMRSSALASSALFASPATQQAQLQLNGDGPGGSLADRPAASHTRRRASVDEGALRGMHCTRGGAKDGPAGRSAGSLVLPSISSVPRAVM